jgi:hypothetical protein
MSFARVIILTTFLRAYPKNNPPRNPPPTVAETWPVNLYLYLLYKEILQSPSNLNIWVKKAIGLRGRFF